MRSLEQNAARGRAEPGQRPEDACYAAHETHPDYGETCPCWTCQAPIREARDAERRNTLARLRADRGAA